MVNNYKNYSLSCTDESYDGSAKITRQSNTEVTLTYATPYYTADYTGVIVSDGGDGKVKLSGKYDWYHIGGTVDGLPEPGSLGCPGPRNSYP